MTLTAKITQKGQVTIPKEIKEIQESIIKGLKGSPIHIVSAMLYGSWANERQTPDSDIDLLVVANDLPHKRNRRHKEILLIKKGLSLGIPSDILLLNKEECISNFRNHNPLFLDIVCDGIILLDKDSFIKTLIEETRRYIIEKEIKRMDDGWRFPVIERIPTYLSKVSNKDFVIVMLTDGKRDLEIGNTLIEKHYFDKAVYHFQQSIEKGVKAILICFGIFKKTHFVGEILLKEIEDREMEDIWQERLKRAATASLRIEPEVTWSRYPGIDNDTLWIPYEEYTMDDAIEFQKDCKEVICIVQNFVDWWFS